MFRKIVLPALFLLFAYFIISNNDIKVIVAGVAIFLVGMFFMEDGFKLFSGSLLERVLEKFTSTLPRSIATGFISTTLVQSSSLVSIIIISFLSAGLIGLSQAIGVIFGSNLGSTTTAWLISYFGFKINISYYAMPMLIFGVTFKFSKQNRFKGLGDILIGLGFIFLGISYMKEGFETLKNSVDLAAYSIDGYYGILIYIIIGAVITTIIQSSGATMAIVITALASGQIIYINALALAIGANMGTTVTAILSSLASNENGKRLAIAHFIFNFITAFIAFIFLYQLSDIVNILAPKLGIDENNLLLKLALFHTLFNVLGIIIISPFIKLMVLYLQKIFIPKVRSYSKPKYLDVYVIEVPKSALVSIRKEVINLYEKSLKSITHAMSLHRKEIFSQSNLKEIVYLSNKKIDTNIDKIYKYNLKSLYGEIIKYSTLSQKNMKEKDIINVGYFKTASRDIIQTVKDIKELQKNINRFLFNPNEHIKKEYNFLRHEIAHTLKSIEYLREESLTQEERVYKINLLTNRLDRLDIIENGRIDKLIRKQKINTNMATSLINDSAFAHHICKKLINIATILWIKNQEEKKVSVKEEDEVTEEFKK